jgi:hypothetical protein
MILLTHYPRPLASLTHYPRPISFVNPLTSSDFTLHKPVRNSGENFKLLTLKIL